jgi:hypothetical protein
MSSRSRGSLMKVWALTRSRTFYQFMLFVKTSNDVRSYGFVKYSEAFELAACLSGRAVMRLRFW